MMDSEKFISNYKTIELSYAIELCEEHGTSFEEYSVDYPSSGLNGWIDCKQLMTWLGY